ncbi:hypothetical protein OAA48_00595, partial [bacterium]|nr:hypothetical protein [bacterium]
MKPKTQKEHELDSHKQAMKDLDNQVNDAKSKAYFSSTLQARETMKQLGPDMTRGLVDWLKEVQKGKAVTLCAAAYAPELLNLMGFAKPEVITIILLKSVLDTHGQFESPTVSKVAGFIGGRIEDEVRFRFYEKTAPDEVVKAARQRVSRIGSTPRYRR